MHDSTKIFLAKMKHFVANYRVHEELTLEGLPFLEFVLSAMLEFLLPYFKKISSCPYIEGNRI